MASTKREDDMGMIRHLGAVVLPFLALTAVAQAPAGTSIVAEVTGRFQASKPTVVMSYDVTYALLNIRLKRVAGATLKATEGTWRGGHAAGGARRSSGCRRGAGAYRTCDGGIGRCDTRRRGGRLCAGALRRRLARETARLPRGDSRSLEGFRPQEGGAVFSQSPAAPARLTHFSTARRPMAWSVRRSPAAGRRRSARSGDNRDSRRINSRRSSRR